MHDFIRVTGLTVECAVGVHPHERHRLQPVVADIELALAIESAAVEEKLSLTVDYASVCAQTAFVLENSRFRLLETAAHALAKLFLLPGPCPVHEVDIRLAKPGALAGNAVPSVRIVRTSAWASYDASPEPFGTAVVVHRTADATLYRLTIAEGRSIARSALRRFGAARLPGEGLRRDEDGLTNPTARPQYVLCIDRSPPDSSP